MRYIKLNSFMKRYESLDPTNQRQAREAFRRFKDDPGHPSLRVKKLPGTDIWYGHVTRAKVFTFEKEDDCYRFRSIGRHQVLGQERRR